jgi:hypothetical protein
MEINGDVNISNSQIDVAVVGDLNANILNSELNVVGTVEISNAELNVAGNVAITNETLNANITNAELSVSGTVAISNDVINANIENASISTDVLNQQLKTNKLVQFYEIEKEIIDPYLGIDSIFTEKGKILESGVFDSFVYTVSLKLEYEDGTFDINDPFYNLNYFTAFNNSIPIEDIKVDIDVETHYSLTEQLKSFRNENDGFTYISETYKRDFEIVVDELEISFGVINTNELKTAKKLIYKVQMFAFDSDSQKEILVKQKEPVEIKNDIPLNVKVQDERAVNGILTSGLNRTGGEFNTGYLTKPKDAKGIMIAFKYTDIKGSFTTPKIEMISRNTTFFQATFSAEYSNIPLASSPSIYTNIIFHQNGDGITESTTAPKMYFRKIILPNVFQIRVFKDFLNTHNYNYEMYYEWLY